MELIAIIWPLQVKRSITDNIIRGHKKYTAIDIRHNDKMYKTTQVFI